MFKEMFKSSDTSPIYQLKKHYPEIYEKVMATRNQSNVMLFLNKILKKELHKDCIEKTSILTVISNFITS